MRRLAFLFEPSKFFATGITPYAGKSARRSVPKVDTGIYPKLVQLCRPLRIMQSVILYNCAYDVRVEEFHERSKDLGQLTDFIFIGMRPLRPLCCGFPPLAVFPRALISP